MSFSCWTVNGYGAKVALGAITDKGLSTLVNTNSAAKNIVKEWLDLTADYEVSASASNFIGYENEEGQMGIFAFLGDVISKSEGFPLKGVCDHSTNEWYLVYEPGYPWQAIYEKEKELTPEKIAEVIARYVKVLNPDYPTPECGYQSITQFG